MYNHTDSDYNCPICIAINGEESGETMIKKGDIFYRDNLVMALINSKFVKNNPGHVIIVPLEHFENIYDLPDNVAASVIHLSKTVSIALKKVRRCEGVTIVQNNEPIGGQHALHYHMHIYPRFKNDDLHGNILNTRVSTAEERIQFSNELKEYFTKLNK